MNGRLEYKSILGEVEDLDASKKTVVMNWGSYDSLDYGNDIFEQKAFSQTLESRAEKGLVYWLKDHDHSVDGIIGKVISVEETKTHLRVIGECYDDNVFKLYEGGVLRQHSAGYVVTEGERERKSGIRRIKKAILMEGSTTLWGMNEDTDTVQILRKSALTLEQVEDEMDSLIKAISNGKYTEDVFPLLEMKLMSIRDTYKDMILKAASDSKIIEEKSLNVELLEKLKGLSNIFVSNNN